LATIKDKKDAQKILAFSQGHGLFPKFTYVWVGLNKISGEWQWASGYPCDNDDCSSLPYWGMGAPDTAPEEYNCAGTYNGPWGSGWDDMLTVWKCSDKKIQFVCDKYPVSVSAASGQQIPAFMDGNNMDVDAEGFTLMLTVKDLVIAVLSVMAVICTVITCLVNGNSGSTVYRK